MDCPICFDTVVLGEKNVVTTECGHTFHASCLMKSVAHNGFGCPYCRTAMAEEVADDEDDEDEEYEDDEESLSSEEAREEEECEESYHLAGLRWLFNRANSEEPVAFCLADHTGVEGIVNGPTPEFIMEKLKESGVTFYDLGLSFLSGVMELNFDEEVQKKIDEREEALVEKVDRIICDCMSLTGERAPNPNLNPAFDDHVMERFTRVV
uniref:RING-type domain-containing protein n=1 Tax=viral metagenome TaxID=1070528 RepID=A0A6C0LKN5_9ZZZZ